MRKTTQGFCAACFLVGGTNGTAGARRRDWDRLPSLIENEDARARNRQRSPAPNGDARQAGMGKSSSCADIGQGTSSSSSNLHVGSKGKPLLSQMLLQQKQHVQIEARPSIISVKSERSEKSEKSEEDTDNALSRLLQPAPRKSFGMATPQMFRSQSSASGASSSAPHRPNSWRCGVDGASASAAKAGTQQASSEKARPSQRWKDAALLVAASKGKDVGGGAEGSGPVSKAAPHRQNASGLSASPELAGGFRRGDLVQSLTCRMRQGLKVLELGHEGTVVGLAAGGSSGSAETDQRLLVQFKPGFDWVLSPHQVCLQPNFQASTSAGLPGGFKWGDRVQSLLLKLHPRGAKRGLILGEQGVVIGPGSANGKLAIRLENDSTEWSLWPNTVCKVEAYSNAIAAKLPGGFRRGDQVQTRAIRAASGTANAAATLLEDGLEGLVLGPGHAPGRLLVYFERAPSGWSVEPNVLVPVIG